MSTLRKLICFLVLVASGCQITGGVEWTDPKSGAKAGLTVGNGKAGK